MLLALAADARSFRLLADSDRTTRLGASIAARYIASIALAGGRRVVVVEKTEKGGAKAEKVPSAGSRRAPRDLRAEAQRVPRLYSVSTLSRNDRAAIERRLLPHYCYTPPLTLLW